MKILLFTLTSTVLLALTGYAENPQKHTAAPPDNTAKNERDRNHQSVTPLDQSNSPEDLKTTQSIRQALMKDSTLSTTAKNVKIITAEGQVTLRGPVNTPEEKAEIVKVAKSAAGNAKVVTQLEVKSAR